MKNTQKIIFLSLVIPFLAHGANLNPVFEEVKPDVLPLNGPSPMEEKSKLNLEPCPVVTPGQSKNYGPMYGEHLVVAEGQQNDAYYIVPLIPIKESPVNAQLRLKDLGYLLPSDFEIASAAPDTKRIAAKHVKSNVEWNGWKGQTQLPTAGLAEAYIASIATGKPGYLMPGGARMQPSGAAFSYSKGNVYQTADPDVNAKVTEDCQFVPQSKSDLEKLTNPAPVTSSGGGQGGGAQDALSLMMSALQQALSAAQGQQSGTTNSSSGRQPPTPDPLTLANRTNVIGQAFSSGIPVTLLDSVLGAVTKLLESIVRGSFSDGIPTVVLE